MSIIHFLQRRESKARTMRWSVGAFLALAFTAQAFAFGLQDVDARARALAEKAYVDPGSNLSSALHDLSEDKYHAISFRPAAAKWKNTKLPYEVEFFHEGWRFDRAVKISEIVGKDVHEIKFDPQAFDYGRSGVDAAAAKNLGFAGFHLNYPLNEMARKDEVLSFLGASYFRALGRNQLYGLSARGLAIDTALSSGEEFPRFVEFWIERPAAQAKQVIVYALLDSPRVTGAYRFALAPGNETVVEVTAKIHPRDKIEKLGVAPLTSMFFFGSNQHAASEDFRSEVHDSDGLSIQSDDGSWTWRPLVNPKRLLVTSFQLNNPRGFGLMQRNHAFVSYEDVDARYESHPSAWIEPIGNWGKGRVELVEIPSPDETNDNIVAYWIDDNPIVPNQVTDLHYRLHWQKDDPLEQPPAAWVAQTLRGNGGFPKPEDGIGFVIDFQGPMLATASAGAVETTVYIDPNAQILARTSRPNPATGGWRVTLRIKHYDANKPVEMRVGLKSNGKESETWSYILPPD